MRHKNKELEWQEDNDDEIIWVSKSEIKRDAEILKQLGQKLVNLPENVLAQIPLNESLTDAINLAKRLSKESYRRQIQYIGKLLRQCDVEPIQAALDRVENRHNQQQLVLHKIEHYREALLLNGDETINELLHQYPTLERQKLRALIRNAQKEKQNNTQTKAYREIYQYLKQHLLEI